MKNNKLNIIVACEESQAVTKELRALGHNAYSCDLLKCSGGRPDLHFNMDIFKVIKNKGSTPRASAVAPTQQYQPQSYEYKPTNNFESVSRKIK